MLSTSKSGFARHHRQLTYLNANALNDRPALICRVAVIRHLQLPRSWFVRGELVALGDSWVHRRLVLGGLACPKCDTRQKSDDLRLKSGCCRGSAQSQPHAPRFNCPYWGVNMIVCYLRNDSEVDAERCRFSLRDKSPLTLFTLDARGRVACLTGIVQSIQFDRNRPVGRRWRVEMDMATVASTRWPR
jgi:hypothetical protein